MALPYDTIVNLYCTASSFDVPVRSTLMTQTYTTLHTSLDSAQRSAQLGCDLCITRRVSYYPIQDSNIPYTY